MLRERAYSITAFVFAVDLVLVAASFAIAHWLRAQVLPAWGLAAEAFYPFEAYLSLLPLVLVIWGALLLRSGEYRSHRTVPLFDEIWSLSKVCALAAVALTLTVYLFRIGRPPLSGLEVSRLWIGLLFVVSFTLLAIEKVGLRFVARHFRLRGYNFRTLLIVGTSDTAKALIEAIERHRYWGIRIAGVLREAGGASGDTLAGVPILGRQEDLLELVDRTVVDEVIFACDPADNELETRLLRGLQELGVCVRFTLSAIPEAHGAARIGDLDGIALLSYSRTRGSHVQLIFKRLIDITVASSLLLLSLPALAVVAVAVRLQSSGGVLFRQVRCGLNGRVFTMYKFRTMVAGAEADRSHLAHLNEMAGPMFKSQNDPRITRLGRFLRRTSLDELPQLWNVLLGHMSLVGPRPMLPAEFEQLERWQRRRLSMRPGLTCLWQVSGRSKVDFQRWMQLDLQYIDDWSPLLDLKILMKTIPAVLSGRGAY